MTTTFDALVEAAEISHGVAELRAGRLVLAARDVVRWYRSQPGLFASELIVLAIRLDDYVKALVDLGLARTALESFSDSLASPQSRGDEPGTAGVSMTVGDGPAPGPEASGLSSTAPRVPGEPWRERTADEIRADVENIRAYLAEEGHVHAPDPSNRGGAR